MTFRDKNAQRQVAKQRRQDFVESLSPKEKLSLAEKLSDTFWESFPPENKTKIAAYWPLSNEVDTRPLLEKLHQKGISLALPCAEEEKPLTFYKWQPGDPLTCGSFQVQEPSRKEIIESDFTHILIPLLAFDSRGKRLGYGRGHYDRTLSKINQESQHSPLFIGVAYSCQKEEKIASDPHDFPLDAVVTEEKVFFFKSS